MFQALAGCAAAGDPLVVGSSSVALKLFDALADVVDGRVDVVGQKVQAILRITGTSSSLGRRRRPMSPPARSTLRAPSSSATDEAQYITVDASALQMSSKSNPLNALSSLSKVVAYLLSPSQTVSRPILT